jgi:hypothetical protein
MALSFASFGDIHGFVEGLPAPFAWRLGLTVFGAAISFVTVFLAGRTLDEFLGTSRRRNRAARLLVISYFAGSCPLILSTLLGKEGSYLALVCNPCHPGGYYLAALHHPGGGSGALLDSSRPADAAEESTLVRHWGTCPSLLWVRSWAGSTSLERFPVPRWLKDLVAAGLRQSFLPFENRLPFQAS